MKNKISSLFMLFLPAVISLGMAFSVTAMTGCSPAGSDDASTLDRVPNVPPSTRSNENRSFPEQPKK